MRSTIDSVCTYIQDDIAAYVHRELPPLSRARVALHLLHCSACRQEMSSLKQLGTTLKKSEGNQPSFNTGLREKILAQLPDGPASQEFPVVMRRAPVLAWSTLAAATCVAVLAVSIPLLQPKVTNTFNAAGNQMLDDDDAPSNVPAASSATSNESVGSRGSTNINRHLDGANHSFVDGRVDWIKPKSAQSQRLVARDERKMEEHRPERKPSFEREMSVENNLTPYRRVRKAGSLAVEVEELEEASDAVESAVKKAGGFVANNVLNTEKSGSKTASLEIRIPVGQFDTTIKEISSLGEVKAKRVEAEDITAKVSDANEENNVLANDLRIKLAQYQKAKERAARKNKSVPHDWQQRAEIRQMRIQLAQVRARIEYFKKLSDFAALSVELREQPEFVSGGGFLSDIRNTSRSAYDSFLAAARLPINLLIYILAYSPLWLPIVIAWRFLRSAPSRLPEP